jgi:pilus assembly protein CpaF
MSVFSLVDFAQRRATESDEFLFDRHTESLQQQRAQDKLAFIAKQVREQLMRFHEQDSAEAIQIIDLINKAVLGFAAERKWMHRKIEDTLLQLQILEVSDPIGIHETLADAIFAEIIGMNVLERLLERREQLDEIQVVGDQIYEVIGGIEHRSIYRFNDVSQVERLQQNLVLFNRDLLNQSKRWAEVQLSDGSRVTMTGFGYSAMPTLTIRFFDQRYWHLDKLVEIGAMDQLTKDRLTEILSSQLNIVFIGPTNSGKTMLMKALLAELQDEERIITIESRRELMLHRDFPNKNLIAYEIDEDDELHDGAQAFKLALRQSPRRIIHAEVRDADANLYVRACTRGHNGSMTTLHASTLDDVPDVLTEMCMQDGRSIQAKPLALRIARYVVQVGIEVGRLAEDGRRGIKRIVAYEVVEGEILIRDLVVYDQSEKRWIHY